MRKVVYGENVQSICRVCGATDETVAHFVLECSKLVQKEYKQVRHENITKMIHWKLCEKWGFSKAKKWYIDKSEKVLESEDCKISWDFPIQTGKILEHNRPDINVIDKKSKKSLLIDPACLFDTCIEKKEEEKCTNYSELKHENEKMRNAEVIPAVIAASGTVTKHFEKWTEKSGLVTTFEALQKHCLLGTTRIIRKS